VSTDAPDKSTVRVRPLEEADLGAVSQWLAAPHVREWWRDPPDLEAVEAKYLPRIRGDEPTEVFVIECDGRSIGLIQRYRFADYGTWAATVAEAGLAFPDAAGIDYMIGDAELVSRGLGSRLVEDFSQRLFDEFQEVATIVVTPQAGNVASRRVLEKSGYAHVWTGLLDSDDPADSGPAAIYVRHRETAG
jgi:RimJ/RimL family protein N-acetyltransferase